MQHIFASSPIMQVIHVLGNQQEGAIELVFELCQCRVGCIWLYLTRCQLSTALVVEVVDFLRVAGKTFRCGNFFNGVVSPEPIGCTKSFDTRLGGNTGTGENHNGVWRPEPNSYPSMSILPNLYNAFAEN